MDRISPDLEKNRQWVEETFQNCDDILHRQVFLNNGKDEGILVYVEVAVSNLMLEEHVIGLSVCSHLLLTKKARQHFLQETGFFLYREIPVCIKYPVKDILGIGYPRRK